MLARPAPPASSTNRWRSTGGRGPPPTMSSAPRGAGSGVWTAAPAGAHAEMAKAATTRMQRRRETARSMSWAGWLKGAAMCVACAKASIPAAARTLPPAMPRAQLEATLTSTASYMPRSLLAVGLGALSLALFLPSTSVAQSPARDSVRDDRAFTFYDRGPYRAGGPRPDQLLGYTIGDMNTQFATQERVLLAIADAAKDRVVVEEIGSTYERRTMRLYLLSSPENLRRLYAIRRALDRLADPQGTSQSELNAFAERVPAVVMTNES